MRCLCNERVSAGLVGLVCVHSRYEQARCASTHRACDRSYHFCVADLEGECIRKLCGADDTTLSSKGPGHADPWAVDGIREDGFDSMFGVRGPVLLYSDCGIKVAHSMW